MSPTTFARSAATVVALSSPSTALAEPCNATYTHCQTNQCASAVLYLNDDPTADFFNSTEVTWSRASRETSGPSPPALRAARRPVTR